MKVRGCTVMLQVGQGMSGIGGTVIRAKPGVKDRLIGLARIVVRIVAVLPDRKAGPDKRQGDGTDTDRAYRLLLQLAAKEEHDRRAACRQQRNDPDVRKKNHAFSS